MRDTKNRFDRVVPLSTRMLHVLRDFYKTRRPKSTLLFAGRDADKPPGLAATQGGAANLRRVQRRAAWAW